MTIPQTAVAAAAGAFPGMLADSSYNKDVVSYVAESVLSLPIGSMVGQGTLDNQAINLAAITDKMIGIVVHSHAYDVDNELSTTDWVGTNGVKRYCTVGVLRKGRIWVLVEEAVTPASDPLVRCIPAGVEVPGVFRDSADAADLYDMSSFSRFLTTTTGAGLALLEIDMTMFGVAP